MGTLNLRPWYLPKNTNCKLPNPEKTLNARNAILAPPSTALHILANGFPNNKPCKNGPPKHYHPLSQTLPLDDSNTPIAALPDDYTIVTTSTPTKPTILPAVYPHGDEIHPVREDQRIKEKVKIGREWEAREVARKRRKAEELRFTREQELRGMGQRWEYEAEKLRLMGEHDLRMMRLNGGLEDEKSALAWEYDLGIMKGFIVQASFWLIVMVLVFVWGVISMLAKL